MGGGEWVVSGDTDRRFGEAAARADLPHPRLHLLLVLDADDDQPLRLVGARDAEPVQRLVVQCQRALGD